MFIPWVIFFALFVCESFQANETYYIAAVVEFNSLRKPEATNKEIISNNTEAYQQIITSKEAEPADIIVFPEHTLTGGLSSTYVPKVEEKVSPCDFPKDYAWYLVGISCKAREAKKYVVINLTSKENCTQESQAANNDTRPCALNGLSIYNTNVVFDRNGTVISTYRKFHLYGEPGKNITKTPDLSTFTTDFGVTFGHFVCFDILFQSPALDLVKRGITDFAFPTMWFSQLPFLTAVQSQMAWAYANDVNVLAANSAFPAAGSTGSGIYAGRAGPITVANNENPVRRVYIGAVSKKNKRANPTENFTRGAKSTDGIRIKKDRSVLNFTTESLDSTTNQVQTFSVCSKGFCCDFNVTKQSENTAANATTYEFRVGAFNGYRYLHKDRIYLRICGVFACTNSSIESCGATFNSRETGVPTTNFFERIEIRAKYPKVDTMLIQPSGVHRDLLPVPTKDTYFNVEDKGQFYDVSLQTWNRTNLLSFEIFTNYYTNSAASDKLSSLFRAVEHRKLV